MWFSALQMMVKGVLFSLFQTLFTSKKRLIFPALEFVFLSFRQSAQKNKEFLRNSTVEFVRIV
jgi:hypothetical protein